MAQHCLCTDRQGQSASVDYQGIRDAVYSTHSKDLCPADIAAVSKCGLQRSRRGSRHRCSQLPLTRRLAPGFCSGLHVDKGKSPFSIAEKCRDSAETA